MAGKDPPKLPPVPPPPAASKSKSGPAAPRPRVSVPKPPAPSAPKVSAPKVSVPRVSAPKVSAPEVSAPKVAAPKVAAPSAVTSAPRPVEPDPEELDPEDLEIADDLALDDLDASLEPVGRPVGVARPSPARQPPPPSGAKLPRPSSKPAPAASGPGGEADAPDHPARILIEACEAELRRSPDDQRAARLHHEIGRVYELMLGEARTALRHYQRALERDAEYRPSVRGARRLALELRDHKTALTLFETELRVEQDAKVKAYLLLAKGRVLEDLAHEPDAARTCYRQAASLDPQNASVLEALRQAETSAKSWSGLSDALDKTAASIGKDARHRAAVVSQRARVHEMHLDDPRTATELYEYALRLDANVGGALGALKRLLHEQGRWQELISVLEREADQSSDPQVQMMALYQIGRVFAERLGDREHAIEAASRAAHVAGSEPLVLEELARLYEEADEPAALVGVLERLAETIEPMARRLGILHRIAALHAERLEDPEAAIVWHEAALKIDPTYVPALRALSPLYVARQAWAALARMYLEEANATKDSKRRALAHARVADLLETRLERPVDAAEHHAKALGLDPGLESSFKALCRLHADAGRYRELIELYDRAVERASESDVAITYLLEIGRLYEDALGEPGHAVDAYRRVLERDADHLGALHAIQRAATVAGDHTAVLEALEREADRCTDHGRLVELLHQAGVELDEHLGRADAALARYRRVLELEPKHGGALASLGRLYHRIGRWSDLLDVYERELELRSDDVSRVRLLMRMGEIADRELADEERTRKLYRRVISIDPTHVPALHALEHRLHAANDWAGLVEVLVVELEGLDAPGPRAATAFRLGEVYEQQLGKASEAIEAYEQALAAVPDYRPALDALTRVHARQKAWTKLVDLLRDEAQHARDPRLGVEALLHGGGILSERLGQDDRAIPPYEAIRQSMPGQLDALLSLEPLYRRARDWQALADLYRAQSETFTDPGARVAALFEVARLIQTRGLADEGRLREAYAAALEHLPSHLGALEALEGLALASGDHALLTEMATRYVARGGDPALLADQQTRLGGLLEENKPVQALAAYEAALTADPENITAIRGLARLAERSHDAALMARALRAEASWTASPEGAADLLVKSARLAVADLQDRARGAADLEQALARCPEHLPAAQGLAQLLREDGEIERLIDVLSRAANATKKTRRRAELWRAVALLHADDRDNLQAGIVALERVTRDETDHVPTLTQLAELYGRNAQWREAAAALRRVVKLGPARDDLARAHLGLARIALEHLDDRAEARQQLESLLRIEAGHREALGLLLEIHARDGDLKGATDVGKRLLRAAQGAPERAAALLVIGKVQLRANEREAAAESLREAVALAGPASPAAAEYKRTLGNEEPWKRYADALLLHRRQVEAGAIEDDAPHLTFLELARVQHDQLAAPEAAFATLREGIEICGDVPELHVELGDRLRGAGRHAESIDAFHSHIAIDPVQPEAWRGLSRTFEALGRGADAAIALAPLVVLGEATDVERRRTEQRKLRPGLARPASFADEGLRTISAGPGIEVHVEQLLQTLGEGLAKLYPPDFEAYEVSAKDKLTERDEHPMRALCDRLAPVFGVERYDLFVTPRRVPDVVVELSHPASLMVPDYLRTLSEAQQVFMVGRAFAYLTRGVQAVPKLGADRIARLLIAAARTASPGYGRGSFDEGLLEDTQRRLIKAMSRRARRAMEEAAEAFVAAPRLKLQEIAEGFVYTSNRAAALLAGDLPAAAEITRLTDQALLELHGAALVGASPVLEDLFRFWASDPAFDFRRRAGLM